MSIYSRDLVQSSEVIQDTDTITQELTGSGEPLAVDNTPFTMKKLYRMIWGFSKLFGEKNRRKGATKFNGADITLTGTITSSGTSVTGSGTAFTTELAIGDFIAGTANDYKEVASITNNTSLTLVSGFGSDIVSGQAFKRIQFFAERIDRLENSIPSGYLNTRINTTSSTQITVYKGSVVDIQGTLCKLSVDTVLTGSGASKWYYILATRNVNDYTLSSLAVDAGHITANTQVYFPNASSTYSDTYNGHYSSNSRIIAAYFWSGTAVQEVVKYDSGYFDKSFVRLPANSTTITSGSGYFQYVGTSYDRLRGSAITASTSSDLSFTANRDCSILITYGVTVSISTATLDVYIYLNGAQYKPSHSVTSNDSATPIGTVTNNTNLLKLNKGDIIKFYYSSSGTISGAFIENVQIYEV